MPERADCILQFLQETAPNAQQPSFPRHNHAQDPGSPARSLSCTDLIINRSQANGAKGIVSSIDSDEGHRQAESVAGFPGSDADEPRRILLAVRPFLPPENPDLLEQPRVSCELIDMQAFQRHCHTPKLVSDRGQSTRITGRRYWSAVTASVAMFPGMTTVTSPSAKTGVSVSRHQSRASSAVQAPLAMALSTLVSLSM